MRNNKQVGPDDRVFHRSRGFGKMDFDELIRKHGQLSASQFVSIGVLFLALAGVGFYFWSASHKESLQYPARITVEARPGAAILVPFSRRLVGEDKTISSVIYSNLQTDPDPLPVGISIIRSDVYFRSNTAVGHMLVWSPPEVSGQTHFSVSASGAVKMADAETVSLQSESTRVTFQVTGEPVASKEPDLAGDWADQTQQWKFAADGEKRLTVITDDGRSAIDFALYPDPQGRWFLTEIGVAQPRFFWIETAGDQMKVAQPGAEFAPFTELQRRR